MFHEADVARVMVGVVRFGQTADEIRLLRPFDKDLPAFGFRIVKTEGGIGGKAQIDPVAPFGLQVAHPCHAVQADPIRRDIHHRIGADGVDIDHVLQGLFDPSDIIVPIKGRSGMDIGDHGMLPAERDVEILGHPMFDAGEIAVIEGACPIQMQMRVEHAPFALDGFVQTFVPNAGHFDPACVRLEGMFRVDRAGVASRALRIIAENSWTCGSTKNCPCLPPTSSIEKRPV